jgi:hypothetical protein
MKQPLLWLDDEGTLRELGFFASNGCPGQQLQKQTLSEVCCPLTAGSKEAATAAAAAAAAGLGSCVVTSAWPGGSVLNDAKQAAETAMLVLQLEPCYSSSLLSDWIAKHFEPCSGLSSSSKHTRRIARAKAVLAAVAAAAQVPAGAQQLRRRALKKVLDAADVDLLAMLLMWALRSDAGMGRENYARYQQQQQLQQEQEQLWWQQMAQVQIAEQQQEWQQQAVQILEQQQQLVM